MRFAPVIYDDAFKHKNINDKVSGILFT